MGPESSIGYCILCASHGYMFAALKNEFGLFEIKSVFSTKSMTQQ